MSWISFPEFRKKIRSALGKNFIVSDQYERKGDQEVVERYDASLRPFAFSVQ